MYPSTISVCLPWPELCGMQRADHYPKQKKIALLKLFVTSLKEEMAKLKKPFAVKNGNENSNSVNRNLNGRVRVRSTDTVYVHKWVKNKNGCLFRLSNQTVQVSIFQTL